MKRQIPLAIAFLGGVFFFGQYFSPHPTLAFWYQRMLNWTIITGIFAMGLGVVSLWMNNWPKVRRQEQGWGYNAVALVGFVATAAFGLLLGKGPGTPFIWVYDNVLNPISATMFGIIAFFIASAAYRAFRIRSLLATILLVSAVIVMLGRVPLGDLVSDGWLGRVADWLLNQPNLAAKRAVLIGIGFGQAAVALKIILGIERNYLGGDGR